MSDLREDLIAKQRAEYGEVWDMFIPEAKITVGEIATDAIDDTLDLLPATVKPDREWLARTMFETGQEAEARRGEWTMLAWDAVSPEVQAKWLERADAILAAWPGRTDDACECGCGETPAKKGARFVRGHDPAQAVEARLWAGVRITTPGGCWEWTKATRRGGYGTISMGGGSRQQVPTHRLMWELANGPVPEGLVLCHSCDNPPCCNPEHLFLGTINDNNQDKVSKGRQVRGETVGTARLTEESVREIRRRHAAGESGKALAKEFGVGQVTVYRMLRGESWAHVQPKSEAEVRADERERIARALDAEANDSWNGRSIQRGNNFAEAADIAREGGRTDG